MREPSPLRQVSPLATAAVAAELDVAFAKPTVKDGILVAAFRLPRAALARVVDDLGHSWQRANVTQTLTWRMEVWIRWPAGLRHMKSHPLMPSISWMETVPGPAGVRRVTATVCNELALPISGMALECRRHTKIGEAVQLIHELVSRRPQQSVIVSMTELG